MILLIDNYDSFTYNLARYLQELGQEVRVLRNDALQLADIDALAPSHLVISPGPCTPNEAGISLAAIAAFRGRLPILGVCLGFQAMAQVFGARIVRAPQVMHGKTSAIHHAGAGMFRGLPSPFRATRYHSLVVEPASLPADLLVTAWTENDTGARDLVMGIQHRQWPLFGVQFHPEAILTEHGHALLKNFLRC